MHPSRACGRWPQAAERVVAVACGLEYLAICVQAARPRDPAEVDSERGAGAAGPSSTLMTAGRFCFEKPHLLREWPELRDVPLRSLVSVE